MVLNDRTLNRGISQRVSAVVFWLAKAIAQRGVRVRAGLHPHPQQVRTRQKGLPAAYLGPRFKANLTPTTVENCHTMVQRRRTPPFAEKESMNVFGKSVSR
jgi:hypothetical protein